MTHNTAHEDNAHQILPPLPLTTQLLHRLACSLRGGLSLLRYLPRELLGLLGGLLLGSEYLVKGLRRVLELGPGDSDAVYHVDHLPPLVLALVDARLGRLKQL